RYASHRVLHSFPTRRSSDLLERSLNELVRRHEDLRTAFPSVGGQPMQLIKPPAPFAIPALDLSDLDASDREARVKRLIDEEARRSEEHTSELQSQSNLVCRL